MCCDNDAPILGANVRIAVTIEPEAARMLDELVTRQYPSKRASQSRAEVIEMAVRGLYRRTFGDTSPTA